MADFEIEALLQKTIGLKVTSIGKATLDRSILRRMKVLSINNKEAYVEKLKSSALELKELIEEVVIPETWFFRDSAPFKAMIQFLVKEWVPKHKNNIFKVLSIPCSTGEEPYSITMALLDSGWPKDKFTVHAVDISHRSIARAKEGVYSQHSFRGTDFDYRSRFFQKSQKYYVLNKIVRDKVHFHVGNVLNKNFMQGLGLFDVIFFRNVLIYFDGLSRHQAITTLHDILAEDGILFVGHAEANLFTSSPFTPATFLQAFAFHKKTSRQSSDAAPAMVSPKPLQAVKKSPSIKRRYPFQHKITAKPDLKKARDLADRGELEKATEICEAYLDLCGPSAQAFFLLGIIRDSAGDPEQAEKLFRRALYLEPIHEEALVFLSLLVEKTGDIAEAKALKQRIARLLEKSVPKNQNS
jgi:chemotaxis protein methyltransferase WspC